MRIVELKENFQIDVGAPCPIVLSNEHEVYLIFYKSDVDPNWDGTTVQVRSNQDHGIGSVKFNRVDQFKFGGSNDEAIEGHPYYSLGLQPYAIQELIDSDWVEERRKENTVHEYHSDEVFDKFRHFIFFFHDSCFEAIAYDYEVLNGVAESMKAEVERLSKLL